MLQPKNYRAIMLSSTFTDLKEHRQRAIEAISKLGYMPKVMEHTGANADADVIESSLNMVRDSAAYVGVISLKYGQTPLDADRNPDRLSITELEFNEAMRLNRPIVLFLMGDDHQGKRADFEIDSDKGEKLNAFRQRAKRMRVDSEVERVYEVFDSLEQFSTSVGIAIGGLDRHLKSNTGKMLQPGNTRYQRAGWDYALALLEKMLGPGHPWTGNAARFAAYMLDSNGRTKEAALLREKYRAGDTDSA